MISVYEVNFIFVAISGICLRIFAGSHSGQRAAPGLVCLPTVTPLRHEHATKCICLGTCWRAMHYDIHTHSDKSALD